MIAFKKNLTLVSAVIMMVVFFVTSCSSTRTQEDANQYVQSSAITTKVKSDLLADERINALQINVKTFKGVVQLSGFVDSYKQKLRAVNIARNVSGVVDVEDSLVVKPVVKHRR
jgi:osmotically-inducible protein OsmY